MIRKNCNGIKGPFNLYPNAIFPIMYWWLYHAGCYLNFFFVKLCWANWTEIFISCTRLKQRNQRKSISTYLLNGNIFICFLSKEKTVGNMRCLIWIHMFQASFFFTKNLRLQTDEHIMPLFNNVLFVTIQILLNNIQKLKHRQPNLKNLELKLCIRNKQITIWNRNLIVDQCALHKIENTRPRLLPYT